MNNTLIISVAYDSDNLLPTKNMFSDYSLDITESKLIFSNSNLGVSYKLDFSFMQEAEFAIGSSPSLDNQGYLWLNCVVDNKTLNFYMPRPIWKSDAAKMMIEKIESNIFIENKEHYKTYVGVRFCLLSFMYRLRNITLK